MTYERRRAEIGVDTDVQNALRRIEARRTIRSRVMQDGMTM